MMTPSQLKLLAVYHTLDKEIDMSTFESRLTFQKEVYLLQEFGIALGHSFGWYKRGPYSSAAADDGYKLDPIQNEVVDLPELSDEEKLSLNKFTEMISNANRVFSDYNTDYILELLASLHFVINKGYPKPKTPEEAIQKLIIKKPKFSTVANEALNLLQGYGLINCR